MFCIETSATGSLKTSPQKPASVVRGVVSAPGVDAALLDRLARRFFADESVALEIARNNATADATVALLAAQPHSTVLELVGLNGWESAFPHELSGGMRQRVGIARALTTRPKALLMDEPFGALDAQTRGKLQDELLEIWEKQKTTVLFVTHSIDEALLLADRILVFSPRPGRIAADIKVDLPRPRTSQSADFSALARELRGLVGADREID